MSDREEEEQERSRPRVVDKRVASGGHQPPPRPAAQPAEPAAAEPPPAAPPPPASPQAAGQAPAGEQVWTPEEEAEAMQMAQEIAARPSIDWVVNTAVTLANVAATKLQMGAAADASLAIDSLAGILNSCTGRLEDAEAPLRQTLAQLQMAFAGRVTAPPDQPPQ